HPVELVEGQVRLPWPNRFELVEDTLDVALVRTVGARNASRRQDGHQKLCRFHNIAPLPRAATRVHEGVGVPSLSKYKPPAPCGSCANLRSAGRYLLSPASICRMAPK